VKKVVLRSAARETAGILREEILAHDGPEEMWPLGSEDEMCQALGVSRPTLRQAARLLEEEQLLVVRRGISGGLFGRRPTAAAVSRIASVYLRSAKTTYYDLIGAELVLSPACARLAASASDPVRTAIRDFYQQQLGDVAREDIPEQLFLDLSTRFQRALADAVCNPALRLVAYVLMDLARPSRHIAEVYADPQKRQVTVERHEAVANAVYLGDGEAASRQMESHLSDILHWADSLGTSHTLEPADDRSA
jgi:DNA-binding FadR family transcriptional regulator